MEPPETGFVAWAAESIGTCPASLRLMLSLFSGLCTFDVFSFRVNLPAADAAAVQSTPRQHSDTHTEHSH